MATNWNKIKADYVTGTLSYRKLAEKYKVTMGALRGHAETEHWVDLRAQHQHKTCTKALEKISDRQADELAKINTLADDLLEKLQEAIGQLDKQVLGYRDEMATEDGKRIIEHAEISDSEGPIDQRALRNLAASLKDLKEVKGIQSELARQEQEARIANLRRQAAADEDKTSGIVVELQGGAEDYAG